MEAVVFFVSLCSFACICCRECCGILASDCFTMCCRADITTVLFISARDGESQVCYGLPKL